MKKITFALLALGLNCSCAQSENDRTVGGPCDACDLMYQDMPKNLPWETTLAAPTEPGERMIISGTIFKSNGKTPAKDVILYVYHTDNKGYYSRSANQTSSMRHGHLRGWMKTDSKGRYQFNTIRPAAYPSRQVPQHVHPLIKEEGMTLYWIDEYLFDDDPLLTEKEKARQEKRGGNGVIHLTKQNGTWIGTRDIILGMNIPNY